MKLVGKIAVVTGATRGIGRAIALRLARDGAYVFLNYHQDARSAEEIVALIKAAGGTATAIHADSSDLEAISHFFTQVAASASALDILVNNVGTATPGPAPLGSVSIEEYDRVFRLNTRGVFFTTQEALKLMRDGGRIVNISSLASSRTLPGRSVYAGTKGAIEAFTRVWAAELGHRAITVNSVSPGVVETERVRDQLPPQAREKFIADTPLARIGQPEDIADIVAFLCSDEGRWLTAQNLIAAGGLG